MSSLFDAKLIDHERLTLGLDKLKKLADNRSNETSYWENKADDKQEHKLPNGAPSNDSLPAELIRVIPDDNKTSSSAEMDLVCFGLCIGQMSAYEFPHLKSACKRSAWIMVA
ncbi:hypothetical protein CEXT_293241 [Caerostris extrusa]|uniref:Uncharacterized protein n=1 Tax=Caerostris extrusa TaxID=172846 RepID=A0AAV4PV47_CAEEX|nr:hypothetical protein CEXT_293241 [Caerostris extrusa]